MLLVLSVHLTTARQILGNLKRAQRNSKLGFVTEVQPISMMAISQAVGFIVMVLLMTKL
jgi:hypothetical protein